MRVISYLKSVPTKNSNEQKTKLLKLFIDGVIKNGDEGILHDGINLPSCDAAVIQGWVHQDFRTPHLNLRKSVIEKQRQDGKYTVVADASLFYFSEIANSHGYLRYSLNGVFPNTGIYCDDVIDPNRWKQIQKDCNLTIEPPKRYGKNILFLLQRQGGWSMNGEEVEKWAIKHIKRVRQYSDRPIVIRPHPGDKLAKRYLTNSRIVKFDNVHIDFEKKSLDKSLENTWAVVNNNSSSIVGPIIRGYPAFVTDPERSQCAEVSHHDYSNLENPTEFDRQRWLERISMFHWKFSELEDGSCWKHMRNYCQ